MTHSTAVGGRAQPRPSAVPPALVVIDMQQIFRDPASQWATGGYEAAAERIRALVDAAEGPVIWTRFVRDPAEPGSWRAYYERWDECRDEPDSPAWDLTMPVADEHAVLSLPTFSKWGDELAALTAEHPELVVCGVATDCCVLSTVLGAVDAGKAITVVTDACAGATDEAHDQAVALMGMLAPMVRLAETAELV
ncbi:cysteine hydrolase [Agrococcus sp. Marseille-Q4369]|uniref:cysteine hydrolase family protein n=1 Tax=Agrococcus sp. Marseille-Q4369 TaxID=2810513 RepID=UPI001B8A931C|nr:cysteine hydrolase [Agrococcus sp. Marseille-Q4369]QUW17811.1 cysteine hydrolase [Agrococcus sp. Marseille-Q4369]